MSYLTFAAPVTSQVRFETYLTVCSILWPQCGLAEIEISPERAGRNGNWHTIDMSGFATVGDGGHLSSGSGSFSATRRAKRRERRERERRRKGAAASDEAFGGDDVALAEAYSAARRDDVPELEDALQRGVMPRATDADGNTLLHAACARGALRAAKLVVRWAVYSTHPPDRNFLNLQSAEGFTALDLARAGGFRKMEEWLVALGALGRGGTGAGSLAYDPSGARSTGPPGGAYGGHHDAHNPYAPGGWTHPGMPPPPLPYGSSAGGAYPAGVGYPGRVVPAHATGRHVSSYEPYAPSNAWGEDPGVLDRSLARAAGAPAAPSSSDTYLMGALEAALGGGPDDGRVGQASEERRRAQAVVRQVAEAMEERDDALDELDETLEKMRGLEDRLRDAEARAESAVGDAKAEVASQREDEQRAVLSALGLAEERAVQMAAECETTREERDAIASALDFVNDEMENLRARAEAAENALVHRREEDYRAGFAAGLMAYREELGLPAIGAIEAAAAAANAELPFDVAPRGGGNEGNAGDDRTGHEGVEYTATVADTPNESSSNSDADSDADIPVAELAQGQDRDRSSLTPAGAAALARANERRSLSRSQSLEKGAPADAAANALGGLELFEVPLGE